MKISSVSKKVLALALSAALAAAFAPPAAFAAKTPDTTKTVAVTYDANGGTITGTTGEVVSLLKDDGYYYVQLKADTAATRTDDYTQNTSYKWFIDADGDGRLGHTEAASFVDDDDDSKTYIQVAADTTAVTVKANWDMPEVSGCIFHASDAVYSSGGVNDNNAAQIGVTVGKNAIASHNYTLALTTPGGTKLTKTFATSDADAQTTALEDIHRFYFTDSPASGDNRATSKSNLVSGDYTVELLDGDSVISSYKLTLCKVTVSVGDSSKSTFVAKGTTVTLDDINGLNGYARYLDADDFDVVDEDSNNDGIQVTVTGDATYTATNVAQAAGAVTYEEAVDSNGKPADEAGKLCFIINNTGATKYDVTVTGPEDNKAFYSANNLSAGNYEVLFDASEEDDSIETDTEIAGTYVLTVTATTGTDATATTSVSKSKMLLTEVKYDVGKHAEFMYGVKSYFTDEATTDSIEANAPSLCLVGYYDCDYVTLNGAKKGEEGYKVKAGEVNTYAFVQKAGASAIAPEWTVEKKTAGDTTKYVLTVTPAANTSVLVTAGQYVIHPSDGTSGDNGIKTVKSFILDSSSVLPITLWSGSDSTNMTNYVVLGNVTSTVNGWETFTGSTYSKFINDIGWTSTKWSEPSGVASAIASGKAACEDLAAKLFTTEDDFNDTLLASYKALYEAVAAEAKVQLAAYANEAQVVIGDTIYKMDANKYETESYYLNGVFQQVEAKLAKCDALSEQLEIYTAGINSVILATNTALKNADEDTSAKTVAAQLEAATNASSAKAALDAYNALTDIEKSLVPTANVVKANKIVADAETAKAKQDAAAANNAAAQASNEAAAAKKDAEQKAAEAEQAKKDAEQKAAETEQAKKDAEQAKADAEQKDAAIEQAKKDTADAYDLAAARLLTGKRVVAKAKVGKKARGKKFSFKLPASKTGNTATYTKTGSKYIKVSANGKVTFAKVKVGKKTKTYKAKVTVTFGTQFETRTIKYVVKKK